MSDFIQFRSVSDDVAFPEFCPLCCGGEVVFTYQIEPCDAGEPNESAKASGCCCLRCAQQLLASLEEVTMARWQCAPQPGPPVRA